MTSEQLFSICNAVALAGWIILIFLPGWYASDKFIIGIIITLFALIYTWLIFSNFNLADFMKFSNLKGVRELFMNPYLVTAGWVHYLAFDLLAGLFISKNAKANGIGHWLVVPCLLITFMLGPFGLLLYLLIRFIVTGNYFETNF
jgi:ABA4-like protein